uniref:Reelin domain-containing protein n=1 Tax=Ciona savignyi TaxID=51511 RepID=H2YG13_CIOSA
MVGYKHVACFGDPMTTVGHASNADKQPNLAFRWTAPACNAGDIFTIRATVVQQFSIYQDGIEKILRCAEPEAPATPDPVTTSPVPVFSFPPPRTTTASPITPLPGCQYSSPMDISGLTNNFEESLGGWENTGNAGSIWMHHSGPTPSFGTGPAT